MKLPRIALALGLSLCAASAAPLQKSHVPAGAIWFIHLDVDGFKQTQLGHYFLDELAKPEAKTKLAAVQAILNFNPLEDLSGVTLYSRGIAPADPVLLALG